MRDEGRMDRGESMQIPEEQSTRKKGNLVPQKICLSDIDEEHSGKRGRGGGNREKSTVGRTSNPFCALLQGLLFYFTSSPLLPITAGRRKKEEEHLAFFSGKKESELLLTTHAISPSPSSIVVCPSPSLSLLPPLNGHLTLSVFVVFLTSSLSPPALQDRQAAVS